MNKFSNLFNTLFNPYHTSKYYNIHNLDIHTFFINPIIELYSTAPFIKQKYADVDEFINQVLLDKQSTSTTFRIINKETGEIVAEIQLTKNNLNKSIVELLGSSILSRPENSLCEVWS